MIVQRARWLSTLLATLLLGACVQVYPEPQKPTPTAGPAGAQAKGQEEKGPFKPYDEVLKDTRPIDGFFKAHLKRDNTLFLEIRPDQLDKDFGMALHFSRGLGDFGVQDGLPLTDTQLMRFERVGDRLLLIHRNTRFTADPGSPMERSMRANVGNSVIAAFDIKAENKETKNLVVDVTPFLVSDYADVADQLKFYYGNKPVGFDASRSYVGKVMGFPRNVEIDAELTYKASDFPVFGGPGVSDPRSIPIGIRYSIFALPDTPMRPRLADDRVGYFLTAIEDFSRDRESQPFVRYVNRWRLEKKDPTAAVSEPVKPIVYYVDRTVPVEYRPYVKAGIEAWNKAFEAAGFKNAIVAKDAPEDDSTWSAEDMRYSTVRWTAAYAMGYAIGPSEVDPRTGEILNADILVSSEFVRGWQAEWSEMSNPESVIGRYMKALELQRRLPPQTASRMCLAQMGMSQELGLERALLIGLGRLKPDEPMPESYLGDAIRDLVMHEVGHTLGLRHNFKASSGIPHDKLNDTNYTHEHGLTLSVMDYGAVNVAPDPKNQGDYWNKEVGSYDVWAIRYGYEPIYQQADTGPLATSGTPVSTPAAERVGLSKIAEKSSDPLHTYGTDEDAGLGSYSVDPLTNVWDLGSDPMAYARDRLAVIHRVQPQLEDRLIAEGEGYQELRNATTRMIFERFLSLLPIAKAVGGLYFARDHRGDPNERLPFTPVSAAEQRAAVDLIIKEALAEGAFKFDPTTLNKLAPNRWSHWGVGFFRAPLDYPVHQTVAQVQRIMLTELLSPPRLQRMVDNEVRMPASSDAYTLSDLFQQLTGAIWSELGSDGRRPRPVDSFRRNLQRMYTDQLIALLVSPPPDTPEDARSLARYHLKNVAARIENAQNASSLNDVTRAHFEETLARIERALNASVSIDATRGLRGF